MLRCERKGFMGTQSHFHDAHDAHATFLQNQRGEVCISMDDPAYVRSEALLVNRADGSVLCVLHESEHLLGQATPLMLQAMMDHGSALLSALRPDGTMLEISAPVRVM
jgi:hypothetical protein